MIPNLSLSHFEAALLFALFTSVVLGIVSKRTHQERIRYGLHCFGWFMVAVFGLSWLMYFGHR